LTRTSLLVALMAAFAPAVHAQDPAVSPPSVDPALRTAIERFMARSRVPGLAWAVIDRGRIVSAGGAGRRRLDQPDTVTAETLFPLGSVTKMFTAALAMSLHRRGALPLNRPIGGVAPELDRALGRLTPHQLLTHTAGLLDEPAEDDPAEDSVFEVYHRTWGADRVGLEPGAVFSYANTGYSLVGFAVARAGGRSYPDLLATEILRPAGMDASGFRPGTLPAERIASGHVASDSGIKPLDRAPDDPRHWPAGFLYSSAADLGRWVALLANGGRLGNRRVLPAALVESLEAPRVAAPPQFAGDRYAYGLFVSRLGDGSRVLWHDGFLHGYSALIQVRPMTHRGFALVANASGVDLAQLTDTLAALLGWPTRAAVPVAEPVGDSVVTEVEGAALVGDYRNRWPVQIRWRDGALILVQWGVEFSLRRSSEGGWLALPPGGRGPPLRVTAGPSTGGRVAWVSNTLWAYPRSP
jgi:CubicO group peptidase (beta-lactamase class C family)